MQLGMSLSIRIGMNCTLCGQFMEDGGAARGACNWTKELDLSTGEWKNAVRPPEEPELLLLASGCCPNCAQPVRITKAFLRKYKRRVAKYAKREESKS